MGAQKSGVGGPAEVILLCDVGVGLNLAVLLCEMAEYSTMTLGICSTFCLGFGADSRLLLFVILVDFGPGVLQLFGHAMLLLFARLLPGWKGPLQVCPGRLHAHILPTMTF